MSTTYIKTEMGEERMKERSELETVMCHRDGLSRLLSPEGTQIERAIPPPRPEASHPRRGSKSPNRLSVWTNAESEKRKPCQCIEAISGAER